MNITRITIGRVYNLGNYENMRYELTAEVPAGESPSTALIGLEKIINSLNPNRPAGVPSERDIQQLEVALRQTRESTDEQIRSLYRMSKYARVVKLANELSNAVQKFGAWNAQKARARIALQDLGGAANYKDAKSDWQDDDQEF